MPGQIVWNCKDDEELAGTRSEEFYVTNYEKKIISKLKKVDFFSSSLPDIESIFNLIAFTSDSNLHISNSFDPTICKGIESLPQPQIF